MSFLGLFGPPNIEKMKARRDIKGLIKALSYQKDEEIRADAASALGELEEQSAIDPLINTLENDESAYVQGDAIYALKSFNQENVTNALFAALSSKEFTTQWKAALALAERGDIRCTSVLIRALGHDRAKYTQLEIIHALGKLRSSDAVQPLIAFLHDLERKLELEEERYAQSQARNLSALSSQGQSGLVGFLSNSLMDHVAVSKLNDQIKGVIEALESIGTHEAKQAVKDYRSKKKT